MSPNETYYKKLHIDLPHISALNIDSKRVEFRALYPLFMVMAIPISAISSVMWLAPITTDQPWAWIFFLSSAFLFIYSISWLVYNIKFKKREKVIKKSRNTKYVARKPKVPAFMVERKVKPSKVADWVHDRINGVPGDLSSAKGKFSKENSDAGTAGEKRTAQILALAFHSVPGVRIFHGLKWGNNGADFDHAIICGDYVGIIDSKQWAGGVHVQGADDQVTSTDEKGEITYRSITLPHALKSMRQIFPDKTVEGFLMVHTTGEIIKSDLATIDIGDHSRIMTHLEDRIRDQKGKVVIDDLQALHSLLPSPLEAK